MWLRLFLLIGILHSISGQGTSGLKKGDLTKDEENACVNAKTCGACIATGKDCTFCTSQSEAYTVNNKYRCDLKENHLKQGCPANEIINPQSTFDPVENDPVQQTKNDPAVQISPQKIEMAMRPHEPKTFTLTFKLAENYPVDLYYLMDLSYSMRDDKTKLAVLGVKIAQEMRNITQNFRLGFGSFVDKVVMPYVSMAPSKDPGSNKQTLGSPCPGCDPPYGFKNQLKLNDDSENFREEVLNAKVSGNLDSPEGGFDAIMQSVVCDEQSSQKENIGWRTRSRRMLLFSTDASFHFAGDGKLGGIVKPNDGNCHLNPSGLYTESTNQDYPSISQIASKVKEKNVNIIFAVTKDQFPTYQKLENFIPGSETGELANDSSNIVALVKTNYEKITSKVELVTENADNIDIKFFSTCRGNKTEETNTCKGLKIGDLVTFNVTVEAKGCPKNPSDSRTFTIKPVGLPDTLTINLTLFCECDCEKGKSDPALNKLHCNNQGEFLCGTCVCFGKFYGSDCSCDPGNATSEEKEKQCIHPNSTNNEICSDHGECQCGKCDCFNLPGKSSQKYSGQWCNCNDFACPRSGGALCGGIERGSCDCGKCVCNPGWEKNDCSCSKNRTGCMASTGKECNGAGTCECNTCTCFPDSDFIGDTCEDCKNCEQVCRKNMDCVQCTVHKTGELTTEECADKCQQDPNFITTVKELKGDIDKNMCEFKDEDDCIFFFSYNYNDDGLLRIRAQEKKECPTPVNVLAIVLGVIGGIVAVGLAILLVWKLVTTISDKRELARFEKETQNAKWDTGENPIYKQATSTFKNPTYAGR